MSTHELKTIPPYFQDILTGHKRFELRKDDRGFKLGDRLWLREWTERGFTGREMHRRVVYIMRADDRLHPPEITGLMEGHVLLGIAGEGAFYDSRRTDWFIPQLEVRHDR